MMKIYDQFFTFSRMFHSGENLQNHNIQEGYLWKSERI